MISVLLDKAFSSKVCRCIVLNVVYGKLNLVNFPTDFTIPLAFLVHQGVPHYWLHFDSGRSARNMFLCSCLIFGFLMGFVYKEKLLSMLVKKEYERPIDTLEDLIKCGLPIYLPARTSIYRDQQNYCPQVPWIMVKKITFPTPATGKKCKNLIMNHGIWKPYFCWSTYSAMRDDPRKSVQHTYIHTYFIWLHHVIFNFDHHNFLSHI